MKIAMETVNLAEIKNNAWIGHITKGEIFMNNEYFKKIEKMLYRYYETEKDIKVLNKEKDLLSNQYELLENKLKNTQYSLQEQSSSIGFEERVQSSSDGTSYAERELINQITSDEKEQNRIRKRLYKIDRKIREIERNNIKLKINITMLNSEYQKFLELKYKDKMPMEKLYIEINRSRKSAFNLRREIIDEVGRWLNFF